MPKYLPYKDIGYEETEDILFEITAELESIYGQAYEEMKVKADTYLEKFGVEEEKRRKMVETGELDGDEYLRWRRTSMLQGREMYAMVDKLSTELTNVNGIAASIINGYMPEVYAVNTNWTEFTIEKALKADVSFTLYDEQTVERLIRSKPDLLPRAKVDIPKDLRWNKQHLNAAIMQGILQGETIDVVAKRVASVTDMSKNVAVRNAATMITSAQNGGRMDTMQRAMDMGIACKKRWVATIDGHTRPTHRQCDNELREYNEAFSNGLQYPGDPNGEPAEIYNCRCRLVVKVDESESKLSDRNAKELDRWDMSYEEWQESKEQSKQPITRAARNVNRDLDMHKEYMKLLGKRVPTNFKEFQEFKYKHPAEWRKMVSDARIARNIRRNK